MLWSVSGPFRKQKVPNRSEPLVETGCGVFHDGADLNAELRLRVASLALPDAAGSDISHVLRSASRANNSILPFSAVRHAVANAIVRIVEVYDGFLECLWFAVYFARIRTGTLAGKA